MKAMSKFWTALVVGVAVMAVTIPSWAGPLMPDFPASWTPGQAVAGQSTLNVSYGTGGPIYVDWIVVFLGNVGPGGQPAWGYYYQVENPERSAHGSVEVFIVESPLFYAVNFFKDKDLDANFTDFATLVKGHTAANYPNLGPQPDDPAAEFEPFPGTIKNPDQFGFISGGVRFDFVPPQSEDTPINTPIPTGHESSILVAYSLLPPTYGPAIAADTPDLRSASRVEWRGSVPVPTPEPGTVLLLLGAMGVGFLSRRYRRK
jgi:hypothetical protein